MFKNNSIWQFFASVRLALVIISFIAVTSIIGTIIPQNQSFEWYAHQYGVETARFFDILNVTDMYESWWFVSFLILLCINLIVCSTERFPVVWKQIRADGLDFKKERLLNMGSRQTLHLNALPADPASELKTKLASFGWDNSSRTVDSSTLIFSQKGKWSRVGVYIVHASILVIFLGAAIGYFKGFKGSITIPETMERDAIVLFDSRELHNLGFAVRCNSFTIDFYANGMPKEYTSNLTILENGREILTRDIEVNSPLKYKGITFYQSSYEPYRDFVITAENNSSGSKKTFIAPFQKPVDWPEENIQLGIINAKSSGQTMVSSKIWFQQSGSDPQTKWAENMEDIIFTGVEAEYRMRAKQLYATGLQVAKDPGVWWVYAGFLLMLLGLYAAFFMSHRRIWLLVDHSTGNTEITLIGSTNKNRPGFERTFHELAAKLQDS